MMACAQGDVEQVKSLLRPEKLNDAIFVRARDEWIEQSGDTALIIAASNGFVELTRLLLDMGADPSVEGYVRCVGGVDAAELQERALPGVLPGQLRHGGSAA
jgi:hypothetical protein